MRYILTEQLQLATKKTSLDIYTQSCGNLCEPGQVRLVCPFYAQLLTHISLTFNMKSAPLLIWIFNYCTKYLSFSSRKLHIGLELISHNYPHLSSHIEIIIKRNNNNNIGLRWKDTSGRKFHIAHQPSSVLSCEINSWNNFFFSSHISSVCREF